MTGVLIAAVQPAAKRRQLGRRFQGALLCLGLTPLALLVHGYHPYAEDGGIYLAGIKYLLHPELFPYATGFVTAHLRFSMFAPLVALMVRATGTNVMSIMLLLHLAATFLTLYSASRLVAVLTRNPAAGRCAVLLLAAALSVPVAGTSLMLADPYVTARSLALPGVLLGLSELTRAVEARQGGRPFVRSLVLAICALAAAVCLHPLTGGYGAVAALSLGALSLPTLSARILAAGMLSVGGSGLAFFVNATERVRPREYAAVAQTRAYWFLSHWVWYEVLGLIAPPFILLWFSTRKDLSQAGRVLLGATTLAALLGSVVAIVFVHYDGPFYAVARFQPLRTFQLVYVLMLLCLGIVLHSVLRREIGCALVCTSVAGILFVTERGCYASSEHLELPWISSQNRWAEAFRWVRVNTPLDAVVALDAGYIESPGEDAQNFRAISERSTPADRAKDGGIAAISPSLAHEWTYGADLQRNLNTLPDSERVLALSSASIGWVVLPAAAHSVLLCPFHNETVKVCRVFPPAAVAPHVAGLRR